MIDVTKVFSEELLQLKSICMNAVAAQFWNSPPLKHEIVNKIKKFPDATYKVPFSNFSDLHETVVNKSQQLPLPSSLLLELKEFILLIGCKLTDYIQHVIHRLQLDISYIDEIYWTCYGTVDINKIYYSFWKKKINSSKPLVRHNGIPLIYLMAAMCADEPSIKQHLIGIIETINENHPIIKIKKNNNDICYIISVLLNMYRFNESAEQEISALIMFNKIKNNPTFSKKVVQYFWINMTESDRASVFNELLNAKEKINMTGDTLYFVLNQMTIDDRNNFFTEKLFYVLERLRIDWPFSKLISTISDSDLINPKEYFLHTLYLLTMINIDTIDNEPHTNLVNSKLFPKFWSKLLKEDKLKLFNLDYLMELDYHGEVIDFTNDFGWCCLVENPVYYPCLETIFSDADLQTIKDDMDENILEVLFDWLYDDDGPERVTKLFVEVFRDEDERKKIEDKFNVVVKNSLNLTSSADYKLFHTYEK